MENEQPKKQPKAEGDFDWEDYHSLDTIYAWVDSIQLEFPNFISVETIGNSYEGRPIKVIKLSKKQVLQITL